MAGSNGLGNPRCTEQIPDPSRFESEEYLDFSCGYLTINFNLSMKLKRNWAEMDRETIAGVLQDAFQDTTAAPNEVILDMLYGKVQISVQENQEQFTAYKIADESIVWICASCGQSNIFTSDEHYASKGGKLYFQHHEPDCG
jgi:hypothetical protein